MCVYVLALQGGPRHQIGTQHNNNNNTIKYCRDLEISFGIFGARTHNNTLLLSLLFPGLYGPTCISHRIHTRTRYIGRRTRYTSLIFRIKIKCPGNLRFDVKPIIYATAILIILYNNNTLFIQNEPFWNGARFTAAAVANVRQANISTYKLLPSD